MNKSLLIIPLIACLALLPAVLGASEPTLIKADFEPTLPAGAVVNTEKYALWDDFIAVPYWFPGTTFEERGFDIWNYETETLVFRSPTINTCGASFYSGTVLSGTTYFNGYLIWSGQASLSTSCISLGQFGYQMRIYDVSSLEFVTLSASGGATIGETGFAGNDLRVVAIDGSNWYFKDSDNPSTDWWYYNQTNVVKNYNGAGVGYGNAKTFDLTNEVIGSLTNLKGLYNNDITNATVVLGSIEPGLGSSFNDWNRNPLNPEYLTNLGYLVVSGGSTYDDVRTSTSGVLPYTPLYFFERDNILGYKGTLGAGAKWSYTDWTSTTSAVHTETTTEIPGNKVYRDDEGTNLILVVDDVTNTSAPVFNVYETEPITEFELPEELINTPPTQDLEFLGVDFNNDFVFRNTLTDAEGGRVYQAQQVNFASKDINDLTVETRIQFDQDIHKTYAKDNELFNIISLIDEKPKHKVGTDWGDEALRYKTELDGQLTITLPEPVTTSQAPLVATALEWSFDEEKAFFFCENNAELFTSIEYLDADNRVLLDLYVERYNTNDTAYLYDRTTATLLHEFNLTGKGDYFRFVPNLDLENLEAEVIVFTDQDIYSGTLNFTDPLAFGYAKVRFLDENSINLFCDQYLYVDSIGYQYTYNEIAYPEYTLISSLDAGETTIFATQVGGNGGFGKYLLYSWATDETIGLDSYDYLTTLSFTYDNSTDVLDQNTINQLIKDAQAEAGLDTEGGFLRVNVIEGDLVTDTFFSYLDQFNIKSTASKFLVGLILIIVLIAGGGSIGQSAGSSMVATLGAIFGGLGGLFLVTYWGLFPAWVSFTITLIVIVLIASMARNALLGRGN